MNAAWVVPLSSIYGILVRLSIMAIPIWLAMLLAASLASGACSDPPAPPINLRPEPLKMRPDINPRVAAITLHWENRASESEVCFWVERKGPDGIPKSGVAACGPGGKGWQKSHNFLNLPPDTRQCFRVYAFTGGIGGSCRSPWAGPVCATTEAGSSRACNDYATKAVDAFRMARNFYKCDPAVLTGPRWRATFEEHKNWCMGATPQERGAEAAKRNEIMHECRVKANMPSGTVSITVTKPDRTDNYVIRGSGIAPNARVIIRVSGPAGKPQNITNNFANAKGEFTVTLPGVQVCLKPGGIVTFTAEDQDKPASKPVSVTCRP